LTSLNGAGRGGKSGDGARSCEKAEERGKETLFRE